MREPNQLPLYAVGFTTGVTPREPLHIIKDVCEDYDGNFRGTVIWSVSPDWTKIGAKSRVCTNEGLFYTQEEFDEWLGENLVEFL